MQANWLRFVIASMTLIGMSASTGAAQKTDIDLVARDGTTLKASYFPGARQGPGILLLHMCGGATRTSWDSLASKLAARGFHALTLDYRGFGESGGERFEGLDPEKARAVQAEWPGDIDAAFNYLVSQPGVDRRWIGAAGASCGVESALKLVLRHPEVKALVFLSGGVSQAGLDFIRQSQWLPLFLAASEDDSGFVPYMRWLSQFSQNPRNMLVEYKNAGHGTDMFSTEKDLEPMIVEYFGRALGDAPSENPASAAAGAQSNQQVELWCVLTGPDGAAKGLHAFREARKRDPSVILLPELASVLLSNDHLRAGNAQEAIGVLQIGLEEYPTSLDIHYTLAAAYVEAGDRAKAIEYSEKTLQLVEKDKTMSSEEREWIQQRLKRRLEQVKAK